MTVFHRVLVLGFMICLVQSLALAAEFTVDTDLDLVDVSPGDGQCATSGGSCSLRAAIQESNALVGLDSIELPAATIALTRAGQSEELSVTGDLDIRDHVTIRGAGREATIIDGSQLDRVFHVCPAASCAISTEVNLSDLTVRNGRLPVQAGEGGGIYNFGDLTLKRCDVSGNRLDALMAGDVGGGIANFGDLTLVGTRVLNNQAFAAAGIFTGSPAAPGEVDDVLLVDSTVSGNIAAPAGSGGIGATSGELTLVRSLVSDNQAATGPGGIRLNGDANVRLVNSTFSGNIANSLTDGGGAMEVEGSGRIEIEHSTFADNVGETALAIWVEYGTPTIIFRGSILKDSCNNSVIGSDPFNSLGHNIDRNDVCGLDQVSDQTFTDPLLGPLADNGGPTLTRALLPGSPAVDAADPVRCPQEDQRGQDRFEDCGSCDIGAFEAGNTDPAMFVVTKTADTNDGTCNADCSLREAVNAANQAVGPDVIELPAGLYELSIVGTGDAAGDLNIHDDLRIRGAGADVTTIDGNSIDTVITVSAGQVAICHLTLEGGLGGGVLQSEAGGMSVTGGDTLVLRTTVRNNNGFLGGGLSNDNFDGSMTILESEIRDNVADFGGGLFSTGRMEIVRSNVAGNLAEGPISTNGGGGFFAALCPGIIRDSTFSGNSALLGPGGGMVLSSTTMEIVNTTISGNSSGVNGGGLMHQGGTLDVRNSSITKNRAQTLANGVFFNSLGGGAASFSNSIIADGCTIPNGGDFSSAVSFGFNGLFFDCLAGFGDPNDFAMDETDLLALNDNGGRTPTHGLLEVSPARDAFPTGCFDAGERLLVDQRGEPRGDGNCDSGAFELTLKLSTLTVTKQGSGTGTVTSEPIGIDCGSTCSVERSTGSGLIALMANPDPGSCFAGWQGDTDCLDGRVFMQTDRNCTAVFTQASFTTLQVNTTADRLDAAPGDGVCETAAAPGECSLRAAVQEANHCQGSQLIDLPTGTYVLTRVGREENRSLTGDLDITDDVKIRGAGDQLTVIDGNASDRVLDICTFPDCDPTMVVALEDLTIRNGDVSGLIDYSTGSDPDNRVGGNILNKATTTLTGCTVADGFQDARVLIELGFPPNQSGEAGGIATLDGSLTLIRSTVTNNKARAAAGIITNSESALTLVDSAITNNEAHTAGTGGVSSKKRTTILRSTISGNIAAVEYGGLRLESPTDIVNSTISGNRAPATAGIFVDAPLSDINVFNSTVTDNAPALASGSGDADSSAIPLGACHGICVNSGDVRFANSIVASNQVNCSAGGGTLTSLGYNLENLNTCNFNRTGDLVNTLPLLQPLAANGGPTETHALDPASPAVDAADPLGCKDPDAVALLTDQRGAARPADGDLDTVAVCDVGAFEYRPDVPPVPDGASIPGEPMHAARSVDGTSIDLTWDVSGCVGEDYVLHVGDLDAVATVTTSSAVCGLGTSGSVTFEPPAGDLFWVISSVDGNGIESGHGFDSAGNNRPSNGIGVCGIVAQSTDGFCP